VATIRKRVGNKAGRQTTSWQAIVRRGGHRPQSKTFRTKSEAQAWATSVENAINRDEFIPSPQDKKRTMRELLERYRSSEVPRKAHSEKYERHLDFWIAEIGDLKVLAVTRALIVQIRDDMAKDRSPATTNRYMATLRHAFRVASTDWEWANKNPCQRIMLKEPRGRDRHLADDEIAALLEATRASSHPHLNVVVLLALTTGARRGEILDLNWSDIDMKAGRAIVQETKNTDKRVLALVPQVINELKVLRKVRRIDSDAIFDSPNLLGKRAYPGLETAWRRAREEAGLVDFRFHDLRHTFASRMAMSGHSLPEIAAALGHRTLAMVQRYAHLTEGHVQAAMEGTALRILGDE
jgi:integrase